MLATAELEHILFNPDAPGQLSRLMKPASDSWSAQFPCLTHLRDIGGEAKPLTVCVATEDIIGPVRNGGVGSTYASLAEALARAGHHVTILYLRGSDIETGSLEQWIEHYASLGVKFVPVPNYAARYGFRSGADRWLRTPFNMMHYLLDNHADVVHVSEWRGAGYLSMLAKQQGIAFQDTTFIVKASSPWLWNRLYTSQALDRGEELSKVFAERQSIELADMVIGGSLHLLRWMLSQGYKIPRERAFVQPNFVNFDQLSHLLQKRALSPGSRMPVTELVFFGRLEARKGLQVFCQAIRRLIRQGVTLPPVITFLGKPGANLTARPDETIIDYIEGEAKHWPVKVEIITELQQPQAIEYLLGGSRLAVMPSLIENSSMAVYEAAICQIPFIASATGGTPELVRPQDHAHVLFDPHPIPLADKLREAIEQGAYLAAPSFDNAENVRIWLRFHDKLARGLARHLARPVPPPAPSSSSLGVCIYHAGDTDRLQATLDSLAAQNLPPESVLIAVDTPHDDGTARVNALLAGQKFSCTVVETFDMDAGLSFNALAQRASEDLLLFMWEGATLRPETTTLLRNVSHHAGADVLSFLCREIDPSMKDGVGLLKGPVIGSITDSMFRTDVTPMPLLVRRHVFHELGGFSTDYRALAFDREFVAKAQVAGVRCTTVLSELAAVPIFTPEWMSERCYDEQASLFRAIRPQLTAVSLAARDLFLVARGTVIRAAMSRPKPTRAAKKTPISRSIRLAPDEAPGIIPAAAPALAYVDAGTATTSPQLIVATSYEGPERRLEPRPQGASGSGKSAHHPKVDRRVLFAKDGVVHGWVIDPSEPSRILTVEAICDGRVVARAPADHRLVLPSRMRRPDVDGHGFSLRLFPKWLPKAVQRGSRTFDLRIAGGGYLQRGLEIFAPGASINASPFEGYCDPSDDGAAAGWVWMPSDPEHKVNVVILIDGQFYGHIRADDHREDLIAKGIGNGEHGFRMGINLSEFTDTEHVVEVVIAEHGIPLKRSPMVLRKRRVLLKSAAALARH